MGWSAFALPITAVSTRLSTKQSGSYFKYCQNFVSANILQFVFLNAIFSWAWWDMPIIPAMQKAEAERQVQDQCGILISEQPNLLLLYLVLFENMASKGKKSWTRFSCTDPGLVSVVTVVTLIIDLILSSCVDRE